MKDNVRKLAYLLLACFAILIFYLGYVSIILGPSLLVHPYNRRVAIIESSIDRGTIYDRKGKVLAETVGQGSTRKRIYPQGRCTSQVVGFISQRYGRTGLESAYNQYLLGISGEGKTKAWLYRLLGRTWKGNDVIVTLDADLQRLSLDLLKGRRGAVAVLNPRTGEILTLASSPAYDPNDLENVVASSSKEKSFTRYELIQQERGSPLLNRATLGAYPPGSVFKLITAAGALTYNPEITRKTYHCEGSLVVDGFRLNDYTVHGNVYFQQALALSCNVAFARMGLELGPKNFYRTALSFGLTRNPWASLPLQEVPYFAGKLASLKEMTRVELASSAIGQGQVLVSPLQMALVAGAFANEGVIMRPYLLKEVRDKNGIVLKRTLPEEWSVATSKEVTRIVKEAMQAVVQEGTGRAGAIPGLSVAGKTGSAQNPHGATHAWFVGFAPADNPRVAVAVVVENAGAGGTVAAPIAKKIIQAALGEDG